MTEPLAQTGATPGPGPADARPVRWGVIGTGGIAAAFATDLALLDDSELVAVGSRRQDSARAFAGKLGVRSAHGSYEGLVEDPDVDVVYVATPHPAHHAATRLALEAGKAVLCEKPFMMNAAEADDVIALARMRGQFLMEAMWTRFLPHMDRIRDILDAGTLGRIVTVHADHGQWFEHDPSHRLFAQLLGGGALLDLGVYPISFASWVLGPPLQVSAVSDRTDTAVDGQTSVLMRYDGGAQAVLTTTLWAAGPNRAAIVGAEGRIEIDHTWYVPTSFTVLSRDDEVIERYEEPRVGRGMQYEAAEVARCLRAGLTESPAMPLDESRSIMATMDEVRRQIGLSYPELGEPSADTAG